jgi:hypothetical protein
MARRINMVPPQPLFVDILYRIQMATYQLPHLPGIYHELTYATKGPAGPPLLMPTTSSSSTSNGSSDLSTLSGSVRPSPTTGGGGLCNAPQPTRNTFIRNADPDTTLQALVPTHLQLRSVIQMDAVPLNDKNQPMCLSYHLRRGCWAQCKRAHDHNRKLSGGRASACHQLYYDTTSKIICLGLTTYHCSVYTNW